MYKEVHRLLYHWYQQEGRHELPWRQTEDPYKVYISEIMLQQTQVSTVLERFYFPFLEKFPTLESLANAHLDEVLKAWEGLGYYRRARNLHEAAKSVTPQMPRSVEGLLAMKGVGPSTAHAVASFAYRSKVPILDANVRRILFRVFAKSSATDKELWQMAYDFFDETRPYEFNQALMDLGSSVCGQTAQCHLCPLEKACLASDLNPQDFPEKKLKKVVPVREKSLIIYEDNGKIALEQRKGEFLHGLWGFPQYDVLEVQAEHLGDIIHKYTHFHLHAKVYVSSDKPDGLRWVTQDEIMELALSKADYKALQLM